MFPLFSVSTCVLDYLLFYATVQQEECSRHMFSRRPFPWPVSQCKHRPTRGHGHRLAGWRQEPWKEMAGLDHLLSAAFSAGLLNAALCSEGRVWMSSSALSVAPWSAFHSTPLPRSPRDRRQSGEREIRRDRSWKSSLQVPQSLTRPFCELSWLHMKRPYFRYTLWEM